MIRATQKDYRALAFYEAGHAVLLHASGHQIEGIHLVHSVNDWEGIVIRDPRVPIADKLVVKSRLAGPLAEARFWGASAYADQKRAQVERFLESITFDPSDSMRSLADTLLADGDADESGCYVAVSFIGACGESFSCPVPRNGLEGDFCHAYKKDKESAHESLLEVRSILNEAATWARVMRLEDRVLQEPEKEVTVGELLELGKLDPLLYLLKGQPNRPVQHVVLSGNEVHAILDNSQ